MLLKADTTVVVIVGPKHLRMTLSSHLATLDGISLTSNTSVEGLMEGDWETSTLTDGSAELHGACLLAFSIGSSYLIRSSVSTICFKSFAPIVWRCLCVYVCVCVGGVCVCRAQAACCSLMNKQACYSTWQSCLFMRARSATLQPQTHTHTHRHDSFIYKPHLRHTIKHIQIM